MGTTIQNNVFKKKTNGTTKNDTKRGSFMDDYVRGTAYFPFDNSEEDLAAQGISTEIVECLEVDEEEITNEKTENSI